MISERLSVSHVAEKVGVSRQTEREGSTDIELQASTDAEQPHFEGLVRGRTSARPLT